MASSVVQTLFEDAVDGLTPEKVCTAFLDGDACHSPMMEFFMKRPKPDNKTTTSAEISEVPKRRCRTLRRIGSLTGKNPQSNLDVSPEKDDVTVTMVKHDFGTSLLHDEGSHDSGVRLDDEDSNSVDSFAVPIGLPSRKLALFEEDACSPLSYSPVKPQSKPISFSLSNSDDGFFEDFAAVETSDSSDLPGTFATLFKAPVLNTKKCTKDEFQIKKPACLKVLNRLNSLEIRPKGGQKRSNLDDEAAEVRFQKRRRGVGLDQRSCSEELPPREDKPHVPLKRYRSDTAAIINALDRAENNPDLIGDGTSSFCLPTVPGKHQDLKSITPETLAKVIQREYDHIIEKFVIVDCRYPYEYQGGHIQGGLNYYTKDTVMTELMSEPIQPTDGQKRVTLIFHCEFSSERAPRMARFLRNMDRDENKHCYPHLHYPEIYILHGGYKNFFETEKELCEPQTYLPMLHENHKEDLRRFRIKSKSWAGDKKTRSARGRLGF